MTTEPMQRAVTIVLSRDEVLVALSMLGAQTIPGLDTEPLGPRSAAEQALALQVAGRSLRARGLARLRSDNQLILNRRLLAAVGVPAYAQASLIVYEWAAGGQEPSRIFCHERGKACVSHTRPEDVLHAFTVHTSREQMLNRLFTSASFGEAAAESFILPRREFIALRERATAVVEPVAAGIAPGVAGLAAVWAANPRVTIFQAIKATSEKVERHEATLLRDGKTAWWVASEGEADDAAVHVQTIRYADARATLEAWL